MVIRSGNRSELKSLVKGYGVPSYKQLSENVFQLSSVEELRSDVLLSPEVEVREFDSSLFREKVSHYVRSGYSIQKMSSLYKKTGRFGAVCTYTATLVRA